jgi:hypothetical protein
MLTKSDGTFSSKVDYGVGNTPLQVVTSDFNGDGVTDLAVVLGLGDGTLASQRTFRTGNTPAAITAGDFDGDGNMDGNMDLATANQTILFRSWPATESVGTYV